MSTWQVRRYAEPRLSRVEGVSSAMLIDKDRRELYIAGVSGPISGRSRADLGPISGRSPKWQHTHHLHVATHTPSPRGNARTLPTWRRTLSTWQHTHPLHVATHAPSLHVADTGADRVLVVHVDSGHYEQSARDLFPIYSSPEPAFNYSLWRGLEWSVVGSVPQPSGLALRGLMLYVTSHRSDDIRAFDLDTGLLIQRVSLASGVDIVSDTTKKALGALAFDYDGTLWVTRGKSVMHVEVENACDGSSGKSDVNACADGVRNGDESDIDCGGSVCTRCAIGKSCTRPADCASGACDAGECVTSPPVDHSSKFYWDYLDSTWRKDSFLWNMVHGDMSGASYLNPYPIMEPQFCDEVCDFTS